MGWFVKIPVCYWEAWSLITPSSLPPQPLTSIFFNYQFHPKKKEAREKKEGMLVKLVKNVGCSVQGHFLNCQRFFFFLSVSSELLNCTKHFVRVTVEFESSWNVIVFCIF